MSFKKVIAIIFISPAILLQIFANQVFGAETPSSEQELTKIFPVGEGEVEVQVSFFDAKCSKRELPELDKMKCLRVELHPKKSLSGPDFSLKKFDASMPQHRHGMVTKARVKKISDREYLIDGVKFHMKGEWTLNFDLVHGNKTAQVAIPLKF